MAALAMTVSLSAISQTGGGTQFPVYKDFTTPDPGHSTQLSRSSLQPDEAALDRYPDGLPFADNATLHKLCRFFRDDPDGQKEWNSFAMLTARLVSNWTIKGRGGFSAERYIYATGNLRQLSIVYIFTGEPLISELIRSHLAKMVSLPIDFWLHSELRGYKPEHPTGGLETAALNKTLYYVVPAVRQDMTDGEFEALKEAWYQRAHIPCYNWLDKPRSHNWTAVVSCGLLHSACFFGDDVAQQRALNGLQFYANTTVEPDGSYSEGYGYFAYPMGELFAAAIVMTPEEIKTCFGQTYIKGSQTWRAYGQIFDIEENGKPGVIRINYGDNPYGDRDFYGPDKPSLFSKIVYSDGLAKWLREKYNSRNCMDGILLEAKIPDENIPSLSPEGAELPLARAFDNGDCYIRSNWDDEGIVLGLKAGDCGSRVSYSHNRPELNSITLAAFGEYIIVTPGSASYRSKVHNEYDIVTRSANTITIDGKSQKFPLGPKVKEGRWDNSAVFVKGKPHARITRCENYEEGGALLRSDAEDIYHVKMKEASRTVRFVPEGEGGFFIVRDILLPEADASHHYDWRLHIFNRDEKTIITGKPSLLKVERGKADLYIAVASNAKLGFKKENGYMHHPVGRDYSENGPKQGFPGSAIELDWSADCSNFGVTAVLYPVHSGDKAPKIKIAGGKVTVNGKTYELD